MEDLISINEEGIDKLFLDICDYSERINNILNQIDDLINYSANYFKSDSYNAVLNKYLELKISINNVKHNILSYSNDLITVKNKFRNNATDITLEVKKQANNIYSEYN